MNALVCTGNNGVALFKLRVDAAVPARPVAVLAEEADSSRDKQFHYCSFETEMPF